MSDIKEIVFKRTELFSLVLCVGRCIEYVLDNKEKFESAESEITLLQSLKDRLNDAFIQCKLGAMLINAKAENCQSNTHGD